MPRSKPQGEDEADVEEVDDLDEQPQSSRGPQPPRLSITLNPRLKKKLRLAAALADMEENDWARAVLAKAARLTVEKRYPDKVS